MVSRRLHSRPKEECGGKETVANFNGGKNKETPKFESRKAMFSFGSKQINLRRNND